MGGSGAIETFCIPVPSVRGRKSGKAVNSLSWGGAEAAVVLGSAARVNHTASVLPFAPSRIDHRSCQREVSGSDGGARAKNRLTSQVKRERNFGHGDGTGGRTLGRTPKTLLGAPRNGILPPAAPTCIRACAQGKHMSRVKTPIYSEPQDRTRGGGRRRRRRRRRRSRLFGYKLLPGQRGRNTALLSVARVMRKERRAARRAFRFFQPR